MKDYLKSFHDSLQDLKVNTYVGLGFCCNEEIRRELRRRLIRMQKRHSQVFIMMLTVQLPVEYKYTARCDRLFSRFLVDFIHNEQNCYGDVEYVWRFELEDKITRLHENATSTGRGMWRLVLFYNGEAHGSTSRRKHAETCWARTLNLDSTAGLIHVNAPESDKSERHDGFILREDDLELKDKVKRCLKWVSYLARETEYT